MLCSGARYLRRRENVDFKRISRDLKIGKSRETQEVAGFDPIEFRPGTPIRKCHPLKRSAFNWLLATPYLPVDCHGLSFAQPEHAFTTRDCPWPLGIKLG